MGNSVRPLARDKEHKKEAVAPQVHATTVMADAKETGNTTARRAAEILVAKDLEFVMPTAKQKKNLVIAFAKRDMIVYGKAFDI